MRYPLCSFLVAVTAWLVVPSTAVAQDDTPPPPPPIEQLDTSESADDVSPEQSASAQAKTKSSESNQVEPFTAGRAAVETLTGFGMMVGGSLAGLLAGFLAGSVFTGPGSVETGVATGIGGLLGYTIGTPVGVWMGGNAMDGNGSIWATVGGVAGGILVGGALTGVVSAANPNSIGGAPVWLTVIPISGGILGYELSSGPRSEPSEGMSLQIGASPSMGGRGTMLNISGRW